MAGYDRDEVPTLSYTHPTLVDESLDSQSQADMSQTHSIPISIPMSSMESYETGNNLVGSTAPLRSARRVPLVHGYMNRHDKVLQKWDKFFVICSLVAIFLDPMFPFFLSIQHDNKCIDWPKSKTFLVVTRSLTDFVYLLNILLKALSFGCHHIISFFFRLPYVAPESRVVGSRELVDHPTRIAQNYLMGWFLVDLFLALPFPQIALYSASPNNTYPVIIQYITRLFRFLPLLFGLIFETAWANFFINLFTFVLSSHVIGSWWYFFGFERVFQCLSDACSHTGFRDTCLQFIVCGEGNAGNGSDPNWKSWTKNENATACFSGDSSKYGIYKPVVDLTSKNIITRYVFSLFWGFQQISTLAGNQQPSDFVGEVLFTIVIIGLGLLLFAFLIGNMQNFLQDLSRRKQEFLLRQRNGKQWMSHRRLPEELKKRV